MVIKGHRLTLDTRRRGRAIAGDSRDTAPTYTKLWWRWQPTLFLPGELGKLQAAGKAKTLKSAP